MSPPFETYSFSNQLDHSIRALKKIEQLEHLERTVNWKRFETEPDYFPDRLRTTIKTKDKLEETLKIAPINSRVQVTAGAGVKFQPVKYNSYKLRGDFETFFSIRNSEQTRSLCTPPSKLKNFVNQKI